MKKVDFLAIGDTVVDAFIKLKDAHVYCNLNREGCELCLRFGDKVPYESTTIIPATGNSPNAVIGVARLGLKTAIITNLGNDQYGEECLDIFKKEKVNTKYISKQKNKNTNYHYVLWYDTERTIMVKHTDFRYDFSKLSKIKTPWIYLSSLAENASESYSHIIEYLKKHSSTKLAFQPGTFQIKLGLEILKEIYERTEVFFSNVEEAQKILKTEDRNIMKLAKGISSLGPKIVYLSDADKGAYFYTKDELYFIPAYSGISNVLERTGAGDAFSGTIVAGLILGLTPLEAFYWGPINAKSVIGYIGSREGLLDREKLEEYLKNAPANYKTKKID